MFEKNKAAHVLNFLALKSWRRHVCVCVLLSIIRCLLFFISKWILIGVLKSVFFCFVRWFSISNLYNAIYTNFVRLECAYHRIRYLKTHKLISIVSYYLYDFRCSILICSDLNRQSKMVFMELNSNKSDNGFYEELGVSHTHTQTNKCDKSGINTIFYDINSDQLQNGMSFVVVFWCIPNGDREWMRAINEYNEQTNEII